MSPFALPLEEISEKVWERQVIGLARDLGWRCYHTLRSRGSAPGYPDWTLVRDRVVFLELKRETGKPTDAQKDWLRALRDALAEAYIARPRDLEEIGKVLARRPAQGEPGSLTLWKSTHEELLP